EQVSIEELPQAVKATILERAQSGEIDKIERGSEDGQVIYEAEVTVAGKDVELKVAPSGKLLGKEVEEENDDDEENERED
ncbi:MAG: hypothetical protein H8E73_04850, partial [Planctomycetes bacterium]|nr:hypothetical protein [Planctomycetota bacterium]